MGEVKELNLLTYTSVSKYKSIRRATTRGHVSETGIEFPKRPFNNRARTEGRKLETTKEQIYARFKEAREYRETTDDSKFSGN